MIVMVSSTLAIGIQFWYQTYEEKLESRMVLFNEVCQMLVLYSMYSFSDLVHDSQVKTTMGSVVIAIECLNIGGFILVASI